MPDINNLVCECPSCLENFSLENSTLQNIKIEAFDGEVLFLTVLTCTECKNEFVVQIDSYETKHTLEKQKKLITQLGILRANAISKRDSQKIAELERKQKHQQLILLQLRKELQLKYNNSVYYFQNEIKKISINEPAVKIVG